jgi:hypothetical protein
MHSQILFGGTRVRRAGSESAECGVETERRADSSPTNIRNRVYIKNVYDTVYLLSPTAGGSPGVPGSGPVTGGGVTALYWVAVGNLRLTR